MEAKLIGVALPEVRGNSISVEWHSYLCNREGCDECPIRFRCLTTRDEIFVTYEEYETLRQKLDWYGRHP